MPHEGRSPSADTSANADERQPLLANGPKPPSEETSLTDSTGPKGSDANLKIVLPCLMVCAFLAAFDVTVVAAIYSIIGSDFNSSNRVSWIAVGYVLSNTAFQPLYGRLSDIFGRKPSLLVANFIFLIGTLGCALSPGIWWLVASRMVAGMGGGGLNVLGTVILSDIIPLKRRGTFQGYMNIVFASGTSSGGPIGGIMADLFGWRWSFGIQIPLIVISLFVVTFRFHLPHRETSVSTMKEKLKRVDFAGAFLLITCVSTFILGMNMGGNEVPWSHPLIITILPLSLIFFILFLVVEGKYATEPILPLNLLTHRTPLAAAFSNWFSSMGAFAVMYNIPLYYQVVLNLSAASAGLRLIPYSIGASAGSLAYGMMMAKTGRYYWLGISSYGFQFLGTALITTFDTKTPAWQHFVYSLPCGFGFGGAITLLLIALISSVPAKDQATATGMSYLFRSSGTVVGITISQCVLQNLLKKWLTERIHGPNAAYIITKIRESARSIYDPTVVPIEMRKMVIQTYVQALRVVFALTVVFVLLNLLSGAMLEEHTLHDNIERTIDGIENSEDTGETA